jgi:hypothetical protein
MTQTALIIYLDNLTCFEIQYVIASVIGITLKERVNDE